jgi:hypothetical protein
MKMDKKLTEIVSYFSKYAWYDNAYATTYKNEYVIIVKKYPYSDDHLFSEYEKNKKVRIRTHVLGGK